MARHLPLGRAHSVCRLSKRQGNRAQRFLTGNNDDRQAQKRHGKRTSKNNPSELHELDEYAKSEESVDDRRHSCQVRDIDLENGGPPVSGRVLLEKIAAPTPIGNAISDSQRNNPKGPEERGIQTGDFRFPGRHGGDRDANSASPSPR